MTGVHAECGEPVPAGELVSGEHQCRDYVAWHGPVDRRDPDLLDVDGGWVPRSAVVVEGLRPAA